MLQECGIGSGVVAKLKMGQMPSADKIVLMAQYLEVSTEYLMGLTEDPTPPKKSEEMTDEERLAAQLVMMAPKRKKQLEEYARFLKMQEDSEAESKGRSPSGSPEPQT